ncbi:MAG: ABC transporter [Desulfuromonas sp.]|nr:MAG: ABC transporter [Desulfuromonas sp.]
MQNLMVDIRRLELSLVGGSGRVEILRGLDMQASPGETISIVGPSGAGKTTLLMALAGLESPTTGEVKVAGVELSGLSEDDLARFRREHIGIVFQSFHLVNTMTALENVALPLEFSGADNAEALAAQALEATGLSARMTHYPGQLSGGEQQRVAVARAFVARPSLILADEPTGNLDTDTGKKIMDILFSLQNDLGTTLVLVTHDESLAERCDRTIRMRDGRLAS